MNIFTPSASNNGMLVDSSHYIDSSSGNKDIGKSVLDSLTKDSGIMVSDMVEMMVRSEMGYSLEEKQAQITNANVQLAALNSFKMTMNVFAANTIKPLNNPNALTSFEISNSNSEAVGATIAAEGVDSAVEMNLDIEQVAKSHTLMLGGFTNKDTALKEGEVVIDFGKYSGTGFEGNSELKSLTIEIKDGMTLDDVAKQINAQSKDVEASVVKGADGTYSLALMGAHTGESSAIRVTSNGADANFSYNGSDTATAKTAQEPVNAKYSVNGIPMESESNDVSHMGLNLSLMSATAETIKIKTTPNAEAVLGNIKSYVENFNALINQFNMLNEPVPDQNYIGAMHGEEISEAIKEDLDSMWKNLQKQGIYIGDIGMTINQDGTLKLDETKFKAAIEKDPTLAKKIMGSTSEISSDAFEIVDTGSLPDGVHEITIDVAPEKAKLNGGALANPTSFATDSELVLMLGGKEVKIDFPAGDYTPEQVVAKINSAANKAGSTDYTATIDKDGKLAIESREYGTLQSIEVKSDLPELGLTKDTKVNGQDVRGYINGERVIGSGTTFKASVGSSEGLEIKIDPAKLVLGEKVSLKTQTGVLDRMENTFDKLLDPLDGTLSQDIKNREKELNAEASDSLLKDLDKLESEQERWYDYYSGYYSGLTASLTALSQAQDFLDIMFNSDED